MADDLVEVHGRPLHHYAFAMVSFSQSDWVEAEMAARLWTPDRCYPGYGGCVLRAGRAGFAGIIT
jgi:hypothetical protein